MIDRGVYKWWAPIKLGFVGIDHNANELLKGDCTAVDKKVVVCGIVHVAKKVLADVADPLAILVLDFPTGTVRR